MRNKTQARLDDKHNARREGEVRGIFVGNSASGRTYAMSHSNDAAQGKDVCIHWPTVEILARSRPYENGVTPYGTVLARILLAIRDGAYTELETPIQSHVSVGRIVTEAGA